MKKNLLLLLAAISLAGNLSAQDVSWPTITTEAKPGARWWWMGSAVDAASLTHNMQEYSKAGMGTMEITPIYGVQKNEANDIQFLSEQWMKMYAHTESEAARLGMKVDMNTGTGWPFGGPEVSVEDAACKLIVEEYALKSGERLKQKIEVSDAKQRPYAKLDCLMAFRVLSATSTSKEQKAVKCYDLTSKVVDGTLQWKAPKGEWRLIAAFVGKTLQKVKRSAPGGEGYVMNHFSAGAVQRYLSRFERAFAAQSSEKATGIEAKYPHNFFNDSYEVYGADWTTDLLMQFERRRGYRLQEHLPEFLSEERNETTRRIISDYRETLAELLQENFTRQWTDWAHKHGSLTRNQAHGSPGNLIDLYATVDVPECEGFGLSNFGISGLRKDSLTRPNDSDLSMLKYASSAAHIAGKPFTSSETFTWLTEHFRTSLSQCKPDIDLMFVSGVNHVYFHGTTYSPVEAEWPGWKFYASIDMSPTNNIWHDAPAFFNYISRCQSFLQMGQPDNDFLLYLPVYDMWNEQDGRLLMFDIHKMAKRAPRFIEAVNRIYNAGYDMDYISDNFIRNASCSNGRIITPGGASYKALVVPGARIMPADVLGKILQLAQQGAKVVFLDQYPEDVPGLHTLTQRREEFNNTLAQIKAMEGKGNVTYGTDYAITLSATAATPEEMKTKFGLSTIRRSHSEGHHYFISALKADDTQAWIPLGVQARSAVIYNPMDGTSGKARLKQNNGRSEVLLQLASGQSLILKTFSHQDVTMQEYGYWQITNPEDKRPIVLDGKWGINFVKSAPQVAAMPDSVVLGSWTDIEAEQVKNTMATACYTKTFAMKNPATMGEWMLELGDVRESARVRINGVDVATLFAVPFRCAIGKYLRQGLNTIEIEVTNLPSNRIADMDRRKVNWRIFKDTNVVNIHYKRDDYGRWGTDASGLLGPVSIVPMDELK